MVIRSRVLLTAFINWDVLEKWDVLECIGKTPSTKDAFTRLTITGDTTTDIRMKMKLDMSDR